MLGFLALFTVPYFFPASGVISDAYMVGFSTSALTILFIAFTLGFAWWTGGLGWAAAAGRGGRQNFARRCLWWALGLTLVIAACTWSIIHAIGPMNEANYFADRLPDGGKREASSTGILRFYTGR